MRGTNQRPRLEATAAMIHCSLRRLHIADTRAPGSWPWPRQNLEESPTKDAPVTRKQQGLSQGQQEINLFGTLLEAVAYR
ncbi:unnamed protein product, partial [Ectocarpus sp. 13 AM-2016]